MEHIINKLHNLILRLVSNIEKELEDVEDLGTKKNIASKKALADCVSKLVNITIQINKIKQQLVPGKKAALPHEDQEIIERFLAKYTSIK